MALGVAKTIFNDLFAFPKKPRHFLKDAHGIFGMNSHGPETRVGDEIFRRVAEDGTNVLSDRDRAAVLGYFAGIEYRRTGVDESRQQLCVLRRQSGGVWVILKFFAHVNAPPVVRDCRSIARTSRAVSRTPSSCQKRNPRRTPARASDIADKENS